MVEMQTVPDKLGCKNETEAVALTSSCFVLSPNFPAIDLCHAKGSPPPCTHKASQRWCQPWSLPSAGFFTVVSRLQMTETFWMDGRGKRLLQKAINNFGQESKFWLDTRRNISVLQE